MQEIWVPLVARVVGYLLMTFGRAVVESLLRVIRENNWRVGWNFLVEFQPRTLASFLLLVIAEAFMMILNQERWTALLEMDWWASALVALGAQGTLQWLLERLFGLQLDKVETSYIVMLVRPRVVHKRSK